MQAFKEKNGDVSKRLQLMIYVKVDGMTPSGAAATMHMSRSWGGNWNKRYEERGIDGLQDKPRSGRPPVVYRGMMKRVHRMARKTRMWTAEEMRDFIFEKTGHMYDLSYVRKLMKKWGYVMKVPVLRHARRPGNRRIRRFQEKAKNIIGHLESEGYLTCLQDETIAIASARARKEAYTLKNERAAYTYTGDHAKTIVFGLITNDGEGYFERHDKFTKDEFVSFLKNAYQKFGKLLMILDRAPQHKARIVSGRTGGAERPGEAAVPSRRLPRPERHRGAVEADEDGCAGRAIRQVQKNVQGYRRVAGQAAAILGHLQVHLSRHLAPDRHTGQRRGGEFCAQPCRIRRRRRIKPA